MQPVSVAWHWKQAEAVSLALFEAYKLQYLLFNLYKKCKDNNLWVLRGSYKLLAIS